jgi:hypothetical protein
MNYIIILLIGGFITLIAYLSSTLYALLLVLSLLFLFLIYVEPKRSIYVCILLSLVPICIGKYSEKEIPISYFVIPFSMALYLLSMSIQKIPINTMNKKLNPFLILILIYFIVIFLNFLRNPVFLTELFKLKQKSFGIHAWMGYLLSFCYYFIFAETISNDIKTIKKAMIFLSLLCITLSILGIILVYLYPAQDLLYKLQNFGILSTSFFDTGGVELSQSRYRDPTGGYHIGTLSTAAPLGLFLLLSDNSKNLLKWILSIFFIYVLILSGMRSFLAGTLISLFFLSLINRKPTYLFISLTLIICFCLCAFVFYDTLPNFFQRAFRIKGGIQALDIGRSEVYSFFWQSFLHNPFLGVGIGSSEFRYSSDELSFFVSEQLRIGGHGTYISLLYLFGLLGFIPFIIILFQGIKYSYKLFLQTVNDFEKSLSLFCFLFLIFYIVPMAFGGKGSDPFYFAIIGTISGLWIRKEQKQFHENSSPYI